LLDVIKSRNPEPLAPRLDPVRAQWTAPHVLASHVGPRATLEGGRHVINLASANFLGLAGDKSVEESCIGAREIVKRTIASCAVAAAPPLHLDPLINSLF
jgi:7-keto-8-aminopelargonate synthetase-like enzyme